MSRGTPNKGHIRCNSNRPGDPVLAPFHAGWCTLWHRKYHHVHHEYPTKSPSGWWLTYPSEKYKFVSWDDDIPNIWKNKKCSKPPTSHSYSIRIFHPGSVPTIFPWYSRYVPINQRNVSTPVAITWFCIKRSSRPQGSPCLIVAIAQAIQALFHAAGQIGYAIPVITACSIVVWKYLDEHGD